MLAEVKMPMPEKCCPIKKARIQTERALKVNMWLRVAQAFADQEKFLITLENEIKGTPSIQ